MILLLLLLLACLFACPGVGLGCFFLCTHVVLLKTGKKTYQAATQQSPELYDAASLMSVEMSGHSSPTCHQTAPPSSGHQGPSPLGSLWMPPGDGQSAWTPHLHSVSRSVPVETPYLH